MLGKEVIVIGAGLAGSEAAWQLASFGVPVKLVEMRPVKSTPAHHSVKKTTFYLKLNNRKTILNL